MICLALIVSSVLFTAAIVSGNLVWDPKGYVFYCPCMGRFGNQADHFLGALSFAKEIDRTLILPPWRTYKNVPFDEWFKVAPVREYHRIVLAEDFMAELAPKHWPPGKRYGWCWLPENDKSRTCAMKEGNPFGPFWDGLGVDFDDYVIYNFGHSETDVWQQRYPPDKYPVIALKGAPAAFPVEEENVPLQKYLHWSDSIEKQAQDYINKTFPQEKFVGIHLRNGPDWENACGIGDGLSHFMASPQCLGYQGNKKVTKSLCLPSEEEVLRLTEKVVKENQIRVVYVATDQNPMVSALEKRLKDLKVRIFHQDPWLPQIDLAVLGMADHFIGNCVSSFSAFVVRQRKVTKKPTYFYGYS